jgi:nucleoside-diphosphate-sugar epimerase
LKVLRKNEPDSSEYLKSSVSGYIPDISKVMKLGWTPKISLENGFKRTIMSFL